MPDLTVFIDKGCPIPLDSIDGFAETESAVLDDIHTETGAYPWGLHPTNLDIAQLAIENEGYSLALLHNSLMDGIAFQEVPLEYTTIDKTVGTIISDTLLKGGGQFWLEGGTLFVDFRAFTGADAASDTSSTSWGALATLTAADSVTYRDQNRPASYDEDAPVLQDFLDDCEDAPTGDCDGTFETLDNGSFSYSETHGEGYDKSTTTYTITKVNGQVTLEVEQRFGYIRTISDAYWVEIYKSTKTNTYDTDCTDALIESREEIEVVRQDQVWWDLDIQGSITQFTFARPIDDWLPPKYIQSYRIVNQDWHPEGWLRGREETTYQLASIVQSVFGSIVGDPVYSKSYRKEFNVPLGKGLWLQRVTEARPGEKAVWEREDDTIGANVEPVTTIPATHVESNSIIQDGPPPTVSCKSDCTDKAQEEYDEALLIHTAQLRYGRPLTVTTLARPMMELEHHLGQVIGNKVVVGVNHRYELPVGEAVSGSQTNVTLWEYR
jgi:hypothetical protein